MSCWSKIKTVFYCPVQVPVVYGACLQRVHPVSLFGFSSSQGGSHDGEPFMWAFSLHTQNAAALIRKWQCPCASNITGNCNTQSRQHIVSPQPLKTTTTHQCTWAHTKDHFSLKSETERDPEHLRRISTEGG